MDEGSDVTLISTGAMLKTTMDAARETGGILTIEEHSHIGGLGGAVAEIIAEEAEKKVYFKRVALPSEFTRHVGDQAYLRGIYGLTVDGIVENTIALLKNGC